MLVDSIFNDACFKAESLNQLSINTYPAKFRYSALMINLSLQTSSPRGMQVAPKQRPFSSCKMPCISANTMHWKCEL